MERVELLARQHSDEWDLTEEFFQLVLISPIDDLEHILIVRLTHDSELAVSAAKS